MKLKIATNSIDKIDGIRFAFSRFFKIEETEIKVFHQAANSGVPDQPFDEEIYVGAINRIGEIMETTDDADFYISCEAGIEEVCGKFINVQVVCIFDKKCQRCFWGKSAGWQIPYEDIEIIKKSNLDIYLRSKGINRIEELLGPDYSRANAVSQATELALASKKLVL